MQTHPSQPTPHRPRTPLAAAATVLAVLMLTLVGAWVEARWTRAAGGHIIVRPRASTDAAATLWHLRRLQGVQDAVAVFRGALTPDDIHGTGWATAWFYANQTETAALAFLPIDPLLRLHEGRLPEADSLNETVLGHELAYLLHLRTGDRLDIRGRTFRVVGIWTSSTRLPGNFAQISAAAAQAITPSADWSPEYFLVVPERADRITPTARAIWQDMPSLDVVSPDWEVSRARFERTVQTLAVLATVILALLLCVPLLADVAAQGQAPVWIVAALAGLGGLGLAWVVSFLANLYFRAAMALTAFRYTPRLALAALAFAAVLGLLGEWLVRRPAWPLRYGATAAALALSTAVCVTVGALTESLTVSLHEAQQAAADWITLAGTQADAALLRDVARQPGIRGYVIEAYGGLANQDEERWIGPWPPSGVFYGLHYAGGEGTLSVPYRLGYWKGRPPNADSLDEAVVGYDLAQELGLDVGAVIRVRETPFTVVGIREHLQYGPYMDANHRIDISFEALRRVLHDPFASGQITLLIPPAASLEEKVVFLHELGSRLNVQQVLTVEQPLSEIARSYPAAWTLTSASAQETVRHASAIYASMTALCGAFLLSASALAVAGTMSDRLGRNTARLGLLKAVGADEGTLLGHYLQQASVLGIAGALSGIIAGWALSSSLNHLGSPPGVALLFTPRLAAGLFFVATVTAMVAALPPISWAIRQDAAQALYSAPGQRMQGAAPALPITGNVSQGGLTS